MPKSVYMVDGILQCNRDYKIVLKRNVGNGRLVHRPDFGPRHGPSAHAKLKTKPTVCPSALLEPTHAPAAVDRILSHSAPRHGKASSATQLRRRVGGGRRQHAGSHRPP